MTRALALPEESQFRAEIQAINKFQQIVHANMIAGMDYGIIPGTTKPTLLKPGAEKIAKLLGLADQYQVVDKIEDWGKPMFHYQIKCQLVHIETGVVISEGLGECNSMESKYRWRWVNERDLPTGTDKTTLVSQRREAKTGGHWLVYRLENDDIYSQVNTILKMAKKRALVDASLSAGRLSDVFTQDMEDIGIIESDAVVVEAQAETVDKSKHWCSIHGTEFFKRGKMKGYAHPIGDSGEWCNEGEAKPEPTPDAAQSVSSPIESKVSGDVSTEQDSPIELDWLREQLAGARWSERTAISWLKSKANYQGVDFTGSLADIVRRMSKEQAEFFCKEIKSRIEIA